ncbi:MAG: hypothetical protein JRC69_11970 [Deltaproteobacteria bacterium]|nr:hypothetical protein [Deltaproteobacteria bacterium]
MISLYEEIERRAQQLKSRRCVVSWATDKALLKALIIVKDKGLISEPIFIGPDKLPGMHDFRKTASIHDSAVMARECCLQQETDLIIQGHENRQSFIDCHLEGGVLDKEAVYLGAFCDTKRSIDRRISNFGKQDQTSRNSGSISQPYF